VADQHALFARDPAVRLDAARRASRRQRRRLLDVPAWPRTSPAARNAWLLFVTSKEPTWSDPLLAWPEGPLTLGEPHPGFLYPDPVGFWDEIRRWSIDLFRTQQPAWSTAECLALTALVHVGDDAGHLALATATCRPVTTVFLDEPAWHGAGLDVAVSRRSVPDPYRPGQVYEGWWATTDDGGVVGKSPQHPTMHRVYRAEDLSDWLRSAPLAG
jgi:hypothetical protein